eukprot:220774_1
MPRAKKKNQQTALLIWAGVSAIVVVGYVTYCFNRMKEKEQEKYPNKREQITYAGDSKPRDHDIQKERSHSIYISQCHQHQTVHEVARNVVQVKHSALTVPRPDDGKEVWNEFWNEFWNDFYETYCLTQLVICDCYERCVIQVHNI